MYMCIITFFHLFLLLLLLIPQPTVEQMFLGNSANLVNLDTLMAALPPPTIEPTGSLNPFVSPSISTATPPLSRAQAQNPFEANKPPAPSINQLRGSNSNAFGWFHVHVHYMHSQCTV